MNKVIIFFNTKTRHYEVRNSKNRTRLLFHSMFLSDVRNYISGSCLSIDKKIKSYRPPTEPETEFNAIQKIAEQNAQFNFSS